MSFKELNSVDYVDQIIQMSLKSYRDFSQFPLNKRKEVIEAVKNKLIPLVPLIAAKELDETGMGNKQDKIIKLMLAIHKTPDIEDLVTEVLTGDNGMTLYEYSSYGAICTVQPGTNPCATLISNTIGMLAAGNSIIHIPHPRCCNASAFTSKNIQDAINEVTGIPGLVVSLEESSMNYAEEIMNHPDISMVVATGGNKMLYKALNSSKRVIGAGQANPVAIVDETAHLDKAACDIIDGASFDNNIMCTSEKNIVVDQKIAKEFAECLQTNGAYFVDNETEMMNLCKATLTSNMEINRALEGKTANEILDAAGIHCSQKIRLIVVNTVKTHPFASIEMLMPLIPMIQVKNFNDALETALFIEQGYRHTAIIHSQSIENLNEAARIMGTSIFVKNAPSLTGIGFNGDGNTSFTIANITGEGVTTARHFARRRRCTLTSGFSIR